MCRYKIHDKIYDLKDFIKIHPGGKDMFSHLTPDSNITPLLYLYHKNPSYILKYVLPKYEVDVDAIYIEYDTNYKYEKYLELKKLVYEEIHEKKIPLFWSAGEITYNSCMLVLYLGLWGYCFTNAYHLSAGWMFLLGTMNMGFGALLFHETSHYTGFKNQKLNTVVSNLIMAPILVTEDWKYDHNFLHHCFTNTTYDGDFEKNSFIFRHSNEQALYFHHKFQYIYSYLIFILGGFAKGPIRSIQGRKWNAVLFLLILFRFGLLHTFYLYGSTGMIFLSIAQLSHIQYECIQINKDLKNDFLYNQVTSSMNYETENLFIRFITFGLDIQIEHHLFPNIPHSSLRQIKPIVRSYCEKNNIPYIEKPSIFPVLYSYAQYLYYMGNLSVKNPECGRK